MTNSKKVYIKAYTKLNLGDDLFVFMLCYRYKNVQFYIKELSPYTNVFKTIPNLKIIENINDISFDAIVYIGGSIFIENSPSSIFRIHELKEEIIKDNIPTYIIGANFGPYTSKKYFETVKNELLPYVESITFRDTYSYNLFKNLNNVHYAPDVVFSLDTNQITKDNTNEVGISIIHHLERKNLKLNYNTYITKLLEICKYYISIGYTIRLFSFCEYEKDTEAINELLKNMTNQELQYVKISNYTGNLKEILSKIASQKLFITSRFHSIILGLKFNIPIIPICYSSKSTNVLNDLNFPESNIYTFENLENIIYNKIPNIFHNDIIKNSVNQFKDLDIFLNIEKSTTDN